VTRRWKIPARCHRSFRWCCGCRAQKALFKRGRGALLILLGGVWRHIGAVSCLRVADRDEARIGNEERAETVPVTWLAGRAGDHVVERGEDCVHGCDICWTGFGPFRMSSDGAGERSGSFGSLSRKGNRRYSKTEQGGEKCECFRHARNGNTPNGISLPL
jgi:hypothetical protein